MFLDNELYGATALGLHGSTALQIYDHTFRDNKLYGSTFQYQAQKRNRLLQFLL